VGKPFDVKGTVQTRLGRRQFLHRCASAAAALLGLSAGSCQKHHSSPYAGRKAVIVEKPTEKILEKVRAAGFGGIEAGPAKPAEAAKIRRKAQNLNVKIHSVLRGWAKFNSPDPQEVQRSLDVTVGALEAAGAYGADVILLVPGRIEGIPMPQPWEFRIKFDEKSGYLTSVVDKGTERYREYIKAHNAAYDAFRTAIEQLIPRAEKLGVRIAIENVWNNLFVDPRHMAHFIDSFESSYVCSYFDTANCLRYSPPQKWISVLGKRIVRCHVKDFKLDPDGHGGRFVNIREGSINWPQVIKALDKVGYKGWMTIEGSTKLSLIERSKRLDLIISGV